MKKFFLSAAGASLIASSTVAAAAPVQFDRASANVEESEEVGLEVSPILIVLLFGAAAAAIIALIESNDGDGVDTPVSP